jgi:hypothetical protein
VLAQTYPHFRVCIYDNASGDETAAVVAATAKGDSRVQYHCHPENLGVVGNFLYAMERVATPFFSFLCDDDVLLPDFYEYAMGGFQKFPEAGFSALATIAIHPRDRIAVVGSRGWQNGIYPPPEGLRRMLELLPPMLTGVVFRRELIDQLGLFDAEVGSVGDIDYMYRAAAHFPIAISLQPGALWLAHDASITVQRSLAGVWPGWLKIIQNFAKDDQIPSELKDLATHILTQWLKETLYLDCGLRAIMAGRCAEAQRSAEILKQHFREEKKSATLRRLARIQLAFPPLRRLISLALAGRRKMRRIWDRGHRQQRVLYRQYEKYLDLE